MDWAVYRPQNRFDPRAEREECERLYRHQARVLQDRPARRGRTDRTHKVAMADWEKVYQAEARSEAAVPGEVLSWGKEIRYYYAHKISA
jgi:hypothetical protein